MSFSLTIKSTSLSFIDQLISETTHILKEVTVNMVNNTIEIQTNPTDAAALIFQQRADQLGVHVMHISNGFFIFTHKN